MRYTRFVATHFAFDDGSSLAEDYARYVEHAVNDRLAGLGQTERRALLQRKRDELMRTCSGFPSWAIARLPAFAWTALRLELARALPLKSFPEFTRDLVQRRARLQRKASRERTGRSGRR